MRAGGWGADHLEDPIRRLSAFEASLGFYRFMLITSESIESTVVTILELA